MIGVVGKQKSVETPSRFRISAMTSMTSIGCSIPVGRAGAGIAPMRRTAQGVKAAFAVLRLLVSTDHPAGVGSGEIAFRPVTDLHTRSDVAGVLQDAGAAVRAGRLFTGRCRLLRGA